MILHINSVMCFEQERLWFYRSLNNNNVFMVLS